MGEDVGGDMKGKQPWFDVIMKCLLWSSISLLSKPLTCAYLSNKCFGRPVKYKSDFC